MKKSSEIQSQTYRITFQGKLDESWQNWFPNFSLSSEKDAHGETLTTLIGEVVDQAALRGILIKLWDLNLTLVSFERVE
ncbi:hypothetical protein ACFLYP_00090 [Chloroflexota bacterium]